MQTHTWEEFFRDPSQFWDNRLTKRSSSCPDFRQKQTNAALWVDSWHNPPWVQENLKELKLTISCTNLPRVQSEGRSALFESIKSYGQKKDLQKVRSLHAVILEKELIPKDIYVTTSLLDAYAKCGSLKNARGLFEELPVRSVVSWNALINGYAQHGLGNEALECFRQMKDEGVPPDNVTFTCILKACCSVGSQEMGQKIHMELSMQGLVGKDIVLSNTLVFMYAKLGMLEKAKEVLKDLPVRDVVCWNALIGGYAQSDLNGEALKCFREMLDEGVSPTAVTYTCVLKACGGVGCIQLGEEIHSEIRKQGLLVEDIVLGTALVDMYAKCGNLKKAREAFEELPSRDVVAWNALMDAYALHKLGNEALRCFQRMRDEGVSPNILTFIQVLKTCGTVGDLDLGQDIHNEVKMKGLLKKHVILGTSLVDMYAKCGAMVYAQEAFDEMPMHDVVAWNALMAGYAQNGFGDEVLDCHRQMQGEGIPPNIATTISILKGCGCVGNLEMGEKIHDEVRNQGLLKTNIILCTALVDMYAKCGMMSKAQEVFEELPVRDVVSWGTLIAGYAKHGFDNEALKCFRQMQDEGISSDTITLICILKVCGSLRSVEVGEEIHSLVKKQGLLESSVLIGTALVGMYTKCGLLDKAQELFETLPVQDVMCWNSLLTGYAQYGHTNDLMKFFKRMQEVGIQPDIMTLISILKASDDTRSHLMGEAIHAYMREQGLLETNIILGTMLMDMYAKCGALEKAQEVFEELPVRDAVCWNSLVTAYAQQGFADDALKCYRQMKDEGFIPDAVTFTCMLKVCGSIGLLEMGEEIQIEARRKELFGRNVMLGTALVDMYAKCGVVDKAQKVFDELSTCDVVTWNALISGYSQLGLTRKVLYSFNKMRAEAIMPDFITFLVLLNAYSHSGLLKEGQLVFETMYADYSLTPSCEHFACFLDLFGRAGHFNKAVLVLFKVPIHDRLPLLLGLLGSCCKWANVDLGRWAFEQSIQLNENCITAYLCMRNIYATAGMQREADEIETRRMRSGARII